MRETLGRPEGQRRRSWIWGIGVPMLLTGALAWFIRSEWDTLGAIARAPIRDVVLVGVLFAVAHLLNSTEFWILYRAGGTRFGLLENWMLFTAGLLANHLPAQLGTVYRVQYMKAVHGAPYVQTAAVYGANLLVTVGGGAVVGLVGVAGAAVGGRSLSVPVLVLFLAMGLGAVASATLPLPALSRLPGRIGRLWGRFRVGFNEIRSRPGAGLAVALLEVGKYGVTAWRIQVTFALIGIQAPIWVFLVLAPAAGIAGFIALTPAALGFREAIVTAAAAAMGVSLTDGLLGATVDRGVMLATALVLGAIGWAATYPGFRAAARPSGEDSSGGRVRG